MANLITLRDVAQLAGVSLGTASQALNNRPNVAPETRARVIDAARTLGYSFKENNNHADEGPVKIIGLLTKHDLGYPAEINPFYSHIHAGVENECRQQQISMMYASVEVDLSNRPVIWPAMLNEQHIDGLILAGTFIEETVDLFQRRADVPVVLVDSYAPNLPFDSIVIDNTPAAMSAIDYLIRQGHRKIGLIGWNDESPPSVRERKIGYCRALEEHGIQETYIQPSGLNRQEGQNALRQLLHDHPDVTAVFSCNDLSALGVLNGAREMRLSVPRDISIMGFDNIDLAREVTPALTTVHVHKSWLGALSVRQIIERVLTPEMPKVTITVSTQLVVRDSVCPPSK
ncbi:MAG: LacI family DNA-binding transcriptional regulator [Anaerolineae bacterium]|nr:LacI family DNA-binding transcriptional regulator [Anaerolineae bacterium]